LQGRGGSPRARRVDVGSKIMLRQRRRRGRRGWRLLRARKSSRRPGLTRRPVCTQSEEVVLGGERSTSSRRPLLLGSWSQLLRQRGERFALKAEVLKAKGTGRLGTTCVAKSRGWDMPRNRPGVRLGSCRHGEWHGPARLRRGGRHSTFLEIAPPGFKTPSYACSITPEWTGSVSDVIF
jgi:hypothetical protein